MNSSQSRKITGKAVALVILVAIVTAVVVTAIQRLLLDNASPAVTGGVVGAVTAAMAISLIWRRRPVRALNLRPRRGVD